MRTKLTPAQREVEIQLLTPGYYLQVRPQGHSVERYCLMDDKVNPLAYMSTVIVMALIDKKILIEKNKRFYHYKNMPV